MQVVFVAVSSCHMWFQGDCLTILGDVRFANSGRMLAAALMGRPGLVTPLCIVSSGSLFARRSTSEVFPDASVFGISLVILEGLIAFASHSVFRSTAKATVAAMSSSSSEGTMKELLNIMCDAVVQLDESLMLAASSLKLDALLLRLPKADAEPFTSLPDVTYQSHFEFAARSDHVAQSLHVKFRGYSGPGLRAQLYHKRIKDVAGRTCHLIGIVEEPACTQVEMPSLPATQKLQASRTGRERGALLPVAVLLSTAAVKVMTVVMLAALAVPATANWCQ